MMSGHLSSPAAETLRWSYLFTLPFFNAVALITNIFIICMFSSEKMKKYKASVFFRFVALMDVLNGVLVFGFMWLAVLFTSPDCKPPERVLHCRMYTVLRYTVQDLSSWGVVCLVMERCSAAANRSPHPSCLLLTVGRFQCVLRHLASKALLLCMSVIALVANLAMVYLSGHELDVTDPMDLFTTFKAPRDFAYDSLAMTHTLLSVLTPSMSCIVAYTCLHILTGKKKKCVSTRRGGLRLSSNAPISTTTRRTGAGEGVTHSRWIHLGFNNPVDVTSGDWALIVNDVTGSATSRPSDVTVPFPSEFDSENSRETYGNSFLDRLYNMIRSREFVLSIVYVEDSRLVDNPPPELSRELNAMAAVSALFFSFMMCIQILYVVTAISLIGQVNWSLMKNIGRAMELVVNNRVNFTLFLYIFVTGRRISALLFNILTSLSAVCCPCLSSSLLQRTSRRIVLPEGYVGLGQLRVIPCQGQVIPRQGQATPCQGQVVPRQGQILPRQGRMIIGQGRPCCPFKQTYLGCQGNAAAGRGEEGIQGQGVTSIVGQGDVTEPKVSIMTPS